MPASSVITGSASASLQLPATSPFLWGVCGVTCSENPRCMLADQGARCARAFPVWAVMGVLHLGLGLALKLYVFQYWNA